MSPIEGNCPAPLPCASSEECIRRHSCSTVFACRTTTSKGEHESALATQIFLSSPSAVLLLRMAVFTDSARASRRSWDSKWLTGLICGCLYASSSMTPYRDKQTERKTSKETNKQKDIVHVQRTLRRGSRAGRDWATAGASVPSANSNASSARSARINSTKRWQCNRKASSPLSLMRWGKCVER